MERFVRTELLLGAEAVERLAAARVTVFGLGAVGSYAVEGLTRALAREAGLFGVTVNCVAPGNIMFPGSTWELKLKKDKQATLEYIQTNVPFKRFGFPEEIANIVLFLASEGADFVTGSILDVNGASYLRS